MVFDPGVFDSVFDEAGGGGGASSFTADSILRKSQSASVMLDAVISAPSSAHSFTASAIVLRNQSGSFAASSVLKRNQSSSATANGILRRNRSASFTEAAVLRRSQSSSLTADAVLGADFRTRHNRFTDHTGYDTGADHILSVDFDTFRYYKGQGLEDALRDLEARIAAREQGRLYRSGHLSANAVIV